MRIGIFGTGVVGQTVGAKLVELGHEVRLGSRDAANEKAVAWAATAGDRASNGTFADAAAFGELLVNATAGTVSLAAIGSADGADLEGKVLIDISNPLDFSFGFPPQLSTEQGDSVAEQIQRAHAALRVVKALNTMNAGVMAEPGRVAGDHVVFVASDDEGAKTEVSALLQEMGWPESRVVDFGGLAASRGLEAYVLFWVGLMQALGTPEFNITVSTA
jgi:predicted dinucleotide-binding enzyme